jgi:hypothetical protein
VQFIANIPADVQLVFAARFTTSLVSNSEYSAVTSVAFSALISNLADFNRTHVAKIICKKLIYNYFPIRKFTISFYLFSHDGIA